MPVNFLVNSFFVALTILAPVLVSWLLVRYLRLIYRDMHALSEHLRATDKPKPETSGKAN